MADIAKLNGVAIGDIAKIMGQNKADLAKVMGLNLPSGESLIDSYDEGSNVLGLYSGGNVIAGQALTLSSSASITTIKFYLKRTGTLSGNITANIYAATGTVGTDAKPTGSSLAVSDTVAASTIPTSLTLTTFTFSSPYNAASGDICISVNYSGGDGTSNYLSVGFVTPASSPSHDGNAFWGHAYDNTNGQSDYDMNFYLYGS